MLETDEQEVSHIDSFAVEEFPAAVPIEEEKTNSPPQEPELTHEESKTPVEETPASGFETPVADAAETITSEAAAITIELKSGLSKNQKKKIRENKNKLVKKIKGELDKLTEETAESYSE